MITPEISRASRLIVRSFAFSLIFLLFGGVAQAQDGPAEAAPEAAPAEAAPEAAPAEAAPEAAPAEAAPEAAPAEAAPEVEEVAPEHFPRIRVFGPDVQAKVVHWMSGLSQSGAVVWWSADVFGVEALVRVVACQGEAPSLQCFELLLTDAENDCDEGTEVNGLCLSFPRSAPDEWAVEKTALHSSIEKSGVPASWRSGGAPEAVRREAESELAVAFPGDAFKVAAERMVNEFRRDGSSSGGARDPASPLIEGLTQTNYRIQVYCTALLALFLLVGLFVKSLKGLDWKRTLGALVLFGVAYALRTLLLDGGVFHENHHGYAYLAAIQHGDGGTYAMPSSYILLYHLLAPLFGGGDGGVFTLNALLSALVAPLLVALFRRIAHSEAAGWLAGISWAILPHAIRMAPTELYMSFVTCMLLASTVVLVKGLERVESDRPAWGMLALALALHVLMAQARVMTLVYPLATAALAFGAGALQTARQRRILGWMGFVLVGTLIPQGMFLWNAVLTEAEQGPLIVDPVCNLTQMNHFVFFNSSIVSPALLGLAILGAAALFRRSGGWSRAVEWTFGAALLLMFVLGDVSARMLEPFYDVTGDGLDALVRHGSAVLLGVGVMALLRRVPGSSGEGGGIARAVMTLLGVCVVVGVAGSVCGVPMSRIRFEVPASALLCGLAGIGAMAVVSLPKLSPGLGRGAAGLLVVSLAFPMGFLETPYPDSVEYQFLVDEVIPTLESGAEEGDVLVAFSQEVVRGHISHRWWSEQIPRIKIVEALDVDEPGTTYAMVGLSCFWDDSESSRFDAALHTLAPASHVEGNPSLTAECREAMEGGLWVPVVTRSAPREALLGSCVHISPDLEAVNMGLYRYAGPVEASPGDSSEAPAVQETPPAAVEESPSPSPSPAPAEVPSDSGDSPESP
jgi:hypothetical protein